MSDNLQAESLDSLRARRDELRDEEERVSYRRRLLHAQLDIVVAAAELEHGADLQDLLAGVLRDTAAPTVASVRAVDVGDVDVDVAPLPDDLLALSTGERQELLQRLRAEEERTSHRRRELLDQVDALQDEIVRRFRRDGVDARALLGEVEP